MRLTFCQRVEIEKRIRNNVPITKIAKELGIARSTIYRDKKRGGGEYNAIEIHENTSKGFHPIDYDIIGKKFGMLTIISYDNIKNHRTWWKALCDCGNETLISRKDLGCYKSEKIPFNCGCLGIQKCHQVEREDEVSLLSRYHCLMKFIEKGKRKRDCWYWKGYVNKQTGMGMTTWNNKVVSVKRLLYKIFNSNLDEPNAVHSSCRDKHCVNPMHLAAGRPPKGFYN